MNGRTFLNLSAAAGLIRASFAAPAPVNKRERMLGWLAGQSIPNYTPALSSSTSATITRPVPPPRTATWRFSGRIFSKSSSSKYTRANGLDRHGTISTGTAAQVEAEIRQVVENSPRPFILGAHYTVEADTTWDRLKHAISLAHQVGA